MGRRVPLSTLKPLSDINLTPLMDLTFILLITFIITFPLIEQGIPVDLPLGDPAPLQDADSRTVTVDRDGNVFLDDRLMTTETLQSALALMADTDPNIIIYIRADQAVEYGAVTRILRELHRRRLTRIALVTRTES